MENKAYVMTACCKQWIVYHVPPISQGVTRMKHLFVKNRKRDFNVNNFYVYEIHIYMYSTIHIYMRMRACVCVHVSGYIHVYMYSEKQLNLYTSIAISLINHMYRVMPRKVIFNIY